MLNGAQVLESKREWGGRGIKEKDKVSDVVSPAVTDEPVVKEKQDTSVDTCIPKVENTCLNSYLSLPTHGSNLAGNTPSMSSGNGIDVVVPVESIRAISERFANIAYGFFLGKRVAYPVVANYVRNTRGKFGLVKSMLNSSTRLFSFQFSFMDGLNSMLENGPWFIRNHPLILRKWNPDVDLLKEDVGNVPVWVKLHGVPVMAFSEDGLSVIATKLGTPLMRDSYTSDMCLQSWGRSSYARVMIKLRADVKLKENIMVAMPEIMGEGYYTLLFVLNMNGNPLGVRVVRSLAILRRNVPRILDWVGQRTLRNSNAIPNGNKKKGVVHTNEVSNSNPFDALNSVDNVVELGTNGGTTNLVKNGANSSGSSFMNFENSSTCNTPIIDKIGKFEDLLIDGQAILVDEAGNPLKRVEILDDYDSEDEVASVDNDMARFLALERVGFGTQSLLEQWRDSYGGGNYDEDRYDDDMYEGQDLP
ncbi:hypothetical protein Tco_0982747 [Tanacetum coccineum]